MTNLVVDATGNELTYPIIGAAMAVHNQLGPGCKEEVYKRALWVELNQRGIVTEGQFKVNVGPGGEVTGIFYLHLLAENTVVIEVKALSRRMTNDELAQVINTLEAAEKPVGLLFNFGRRKLEYKRVFPPVTASEIQRIGRDDAGRGRREDSPSTNGERINE